MFVQSPVYYTKNAGRQTGSTLQSSATQVRHIDALQMGRIAVRAITTLV